jgi:hypothetical protein
LAARPLQGAPVTGDALYCQRRLCQQVRDAGGHCVGLVKANQPSLLADPEDLFAEAPPDETTGRPVHFARAEQRDRHGDRQEVRRLWASGAVHGYLDWPGAQQGATVERVSTRRGRVTAQVRYALTRLPEPDPLWGEPGTTPDALLRLIRGHRASENRLHYVRDVSSGRTPAGCAAGPRRRCWRCRAPPSSAYGAPRGGTTSRPGCATTPGALAPLSSSSVSRPRENQKTLPQVRVHPNFIPASTSPLGR